MLRSAWIGSALALLLVSACGSSPSGNGGVFIGDADNTLDATASDSEQADLAGTDSSVDALAQTDAEDLGPDVDHDLLDPTDEDVDESDATEPTGPVGNLYAHTSTVLWRLDLGTGQFTEVGTFSFDQNKGDVTDIALDKTGQLFATTHTDLFQCGLEDAKCAWLAKLPGTYFGLSYVPAGTIDPNVETLVGIENDGTWSSITFANGKATIKALGSYGGGWLSSGDMFSVEGIGTYATLKGKGDFDTLAKVNPKTGKIEQIIGGTAKTGVKSLFGLAWWQGVTYGFSSDGNVYTLDLDTGVATKLTTIATPPGAKWWGAGVSTRAAGKAQ